jgi:serine/threonine-protein kinase
MSAIESDHIPGVLDAGTHDDGRPFLVMDLLRGEDLGARLHREGRMAPLQACAIVAQILRGLVHAHAAGVVHRDLKPDNVFLVQRPEGLLVKILDFGVSKFQPLARTTLPLALTARGVVLGTPFYIAPEQARSEEDVDARADLYSVGAILFECIAGRPPHVGETYEQVILSACTTDAPDLRTIDKSVSAPVARFVAKALARDRAERHQSAREMLGALMEIAPDGFDDGIVTSTKSPRSSRASLIPWYATRAVVIATGLTAAAMGATVAFFILARRQPTEEPGPVLAPRATMSVPAASPPPVASVSSAPSSSVPATTTPTPLRKPVPSTLDLQRTFP